MRRLKAPNPFLSQDSGKGDVSLEHPLVEQPARRGIGGRMACPGKSGGFQCCRDAVLEENSFVV